MGGREGRDPCLSPALPGYTLPVSRHCTKVSFGRDRGNAKREQNVYVAIHINTHRVGTRVSWLGGDVKAGRAAEIQVRAAVGKGQIVVKPCRL